MSVCVSLRMNACMCGCMPMCAGGICICVPLYSNAQAIVRESFIKATNILSRLCADDLEPYELESYSDRRLPAAPGLYSDPPAYDSAGDEDGEKDADMQPVGGWMVGSWDRSTPSVKPDSDPEASGWSISRELVSTISVGCVLLVSLTALVIFCLVR